MAFRAPIRNYEPSPIQPPSEPGSFMSQMLGKLGQALTDPTSGALIGGPMAVVRQLGMFGKQAGPLVRHAPEMWRETDVAGAVPMMPYSRRAMDMLPDSLYMADVPELALGQGTNKGVKFKFDTAGLRGWVNQSKPGWEHSYENGAAEYVAAGNSQRAYQDAAREIHIGPDAKYLDKTDKFLMQHSMKSLEDAGWTKELLPDGTRVFKAPPTK